MKPFYIFTFLYLAWSSWHHNALLRNLYKNIVELSCPVRLVARERGMLLEQDVNSGEKQNVENNGKEDEEKGKETPEKYRID